MLSRYVLASIGLIIAFLLAAFVIGWFIGRLRERSHVRPPLVPAFGVSLIC
jgi:biotin transporter BioY